MSFWGRSPAVPDGKDFAVLHWPTEDGEQLKFRKNEVRCVLITSSTGPRMHMYAHLRPCEAKEASGLLTVAAAAAPPPPPGDKTVHYYDPLRVRRQHAQTVTKCTQTFTSSHAGTAAAALDQARRLRGLHPQGDPAARHRHLFGWPRGPAASGDLHGRGRDARLVPADRGRGRRLAVLREHLLELVPRREPRGRKCAQNSNSYYTHIPT